MSWRGIETDSVCPSDHCRPPETGAEEVVALHSGRDPLSLRGEWTVVSLLRPGERRVEHLGTPTAVVPLTPVNWYYPSDLQSLWPPLILNV